MRERSTDEEVHDDAASLAELSTKQKWAALTVRTKSGRRVQFGGGPGGRVEA
jgi:hypothetical protein